MRACGITELIDKASDGYVVAVEHGSDRFVPEWGELLDLGPIRRQPYLSSALVLLSGSVGEEVLRLMEDCQDRVDFELTFWRRNVPDYPFVYGDQCVLNAILMARVDPNRVVAIDRRLESITPFAGLRVTDEATLRCAYEDGTEPYAVHHYLPIKPWLEPTPFGVYTQPLMRLLRRPDVAVRVPKRELPPHLRPGLLARARRRAASARERFRPRV